MRSGGVTGPISWRYHVHGNKEQLHTWNGYNLVNYEMFKYLFSYKTKSATTDLKRTGSDLKTLLCSYGVQVIHDTAKVMFIPKILELH